MYVMDHAHTACVHETFVDTSYGPILNREPGLTAGRENYLFFFL